MGTNAIKADKNLKSKGRNNQRYPNRQSALEREQDIL
jgi:hypothetical protein